MHQKLSISMKIWLIAISFGLPIVVVTSMYLGTRNEAIDFAQRELTGNQLQRPLEALLNVVLHQQVVAQACAQTPTAECPDTLKALSSKIDVELARFSTVYENVANTLEFTQEGLGKRHREFATAQGLKAALKALAADLADNAKAKDRPALDKRFDEASTIITTMITHQGDTSNLILDPDLDSYYSMDVTLLALPQTQVRLPKVIAFGRDAIAKGALSTEDRVQLAVFAAMLAEADLARVVASTTTALNEDSNFYGESPSLRANVAPAMKRYLETNHAFHEMVKKLSAEATPTLTAAQFVEAGLAARTESFAFWSVFADELDRLLDLRIRAYQAKRNVALGAAGAALVTALLLSLVVMRSINKPLTKLASNLGPGANLLANCVKKISTGQRSADDTAMIVEELAAHADDMRKATHELVALVNGEASHVSPK